MKKGVIILMALILGIMVKGCNKAETSEQSEGISQEYKDAMSKGKSNVIEEEYAPCSSESSASTNKFSCFIKFLASVSSFLDSNANLK